MSPRDEFEEMFPSPSASELEMERREAVFDGVLVLVLLALIVVLAGIAVFKPRSAPLARIPCAEASTT